MNAVLDQPYTISTDSVIGDWVALKTKGTFHREDSVAVGLLRGDEIVAGVIYEDWNGASIVCHIAATRLTPLYLAAIFHYPFVVCGATMIIAPIPDRNDRSVRLVQHMGFHEAARIQDAHPDGDILLYTLRDSECRFLEPRYLSRLEER